MFLFPIDGASGVPPYLQLVHQVRQSLLLGYLREGDQLPTVKEAAAGLAINANTVVKAYRRLERDGLTGGRPGRGTFITANGSPGARDGHTALRATFEAWLRDAAAAGLDEDAVTAVIAVARRGRPTRGPAREPRLAREPRQTREARVAGGPRPAGEARLAREAWPAGGPRSAREAWQAHEARPPRMQGFTVRGR